MATNHVPVEIYLHSEYEPDADYVDGEIEERNLGQWDHASWQQAIQRWFILHGTEWNVRVRPELRIRVSPTRYRVADAVVIDRAHPKEQIITHTPLAVFEVLSPDDTVKRAMRKLGDYEAMGIPQIWLIDPETNACYLFTEGKLIPATHYGSPGERMYFAVHEMEAFLD
jgi:Uma2 family endonuclease